MIFDRAIWLEKGDGIYAEIGTQPYIITLDGSIYDPARGHLPKKVNIDYKDILRNLPIGHSLDYSFSIETRMHQL